MAAPLKPWEKVGVNSQNENNTFRDHMSSFPQTSLPATLHGDRQPYNSAAPPPVPNRPSLAPTGNSYGQSGYGSSFGGGYGGGGMYGNSMYGNSMYGGGLYGSGGGMYGGGGGGMYGGYGSGGGMYGGGLNRFGGMNDNYNSDSFVQQAEQSSRQAFQSVESVVQAFGSVAMMLDSTFYAVYNSFRAVIGVADQFSRVKAHLTQIISALAIIRTLRWLWRKLLVVLRLRKTGLSEDVWNQAAEDGIKAVLSEQDLKSGANTGGSSWPIFMFFTVIFAGPWILWKLFSKLNGDIGGKEWISGKDEHYAAVAEYEFNGQGDDELSFRKGQRIIVAPKDLQPRIRGWLLASVDGKKTGIIPANYVKILGRRNGTNNIKTPETQHAIAGRNSSTVHRPSLPPKDIGVSFDEHFHSSQSMPNLRGISSNSAHPNINSGTLSKSTSDTKEVTFDDEFDTNDSPNKTDDHTTT